MKHVALMSLLFLGSGSSLLQAGSVLTLTDGTEISGKLTVTQGAVHVETNSSPADLNLPDILEADFGETPFQLDCFFSDGSNQLPATWKAQDIGEVTNAGSVLVAEGSYILGGGGPSSQSKLLRQSDSLFFAGQPWTGDGQWTARMKELDAKNSQSIAGLMLRDTLSADSVMYSLGATKQGNAVIASRTDTAGRPLSGGTPVPIDLPVWLRLTRYGTTLFEATSSDGKEWDLIGQSEVKPLANPWIGLFAGSRKANELSTSVFDQISFTPTPSAAQVLPSGVLLQSGSFLAGSFDHLAFDPANPDTAGNFRQSGKSLTIPGSQIAAVILLPTTRSQIADMGSQVSVLMKNGDVMDGAFDSIDDGRVSISSVLLGNTTYERSEVRACFLHSVQAQPASYEIRLRDGSIIEASGLDSNKRGVVIDEVGGLKIDVSPDEIAQFRAGAAQVQSLAELAWKATAPSAAPVAAIPPATNAAPATNTPPEANALPDANAVPDESLLVQNWAGPNQEQIMVAPVGTTLAFPLTDKFRAVGAWIALSPDSPPNSNVIIRVLADGKEIARTLAFRAGDQPRFMEVKMQNPKTVTFESDSIFTVAKVLFIDPVAIRDK